MAWFTISAAFFCFLLSGLDERHLAAVLLENDNILVHDPFCRFNPTLSQQLWEDFA